MATCRAFLVVVAVVVSVSVGNSEGSRALAGIERAVAAGLYSCSCFYSYSNSCLCLCLYSYSFPCSFPYSFPCSSPCSCSYFCSCFCYGLGPAAHLLHLSFCLLLLVQDSDYDDHGFETSRCSCCLCSGFLTASFVLAACAVPSLLESAPPQSPSQQLWC